MKSQLFHLARFQPVNGRVITQRRTFMSPPGSNGNGNQSPKLLKPVMAYKKGIDLMNDSLLNKGVGFTPAERDRFEIRGLLPPVVNSLEEQAQRLKEKIHAEPTPISKYMLLNSLQDRNETLFYRLVIENIKEIAPIIYTPTVGQVCQKFGFLYRKPRGMYFSSADRGEFSSMVYNWPSKDVDVVVVTDGSRILGLGDLGVNGMGIPIGKLALYTAAGGIHPSRVLPIMLDVGTNNESLLNDPFYLGLRQKRLTGASYYSLVDELMVALRNRWPNVLVQFEDFSNNNAYPLLHKYRRDHLCFNDDIQGTGSVALAGIYTALRVQGKSPSAFTEQRVVCMGAGSAGLGVVYSLYHGMIAQGMKPEDAAKNFWLIDKDGLITSSRANMAEGQRTFAGNELKDGLPLEEVIRQVKPTILLGLSGVGGVFTEKSIKTMNEFCVDRPIIFPLSNPTDRAECSFQQAIEWTNGRAIFASGSPFTPIEWNGQKYAPSQGNNMFIFPGVGLAAVATGAKRISVSMFSRAAEVLSTCVSEKDISISKVYPDVDNIREVSLRIAVEVAKLVYSKGLATKPLPEDISLEEFIRRQMYLPDYHPLVFANDVGSK